MRLAGKTALVVGAASGIGRAVTQEFDRQGASVVAADIDHDGTYATVQSLSNTIAVQLDITEENDWDRVLLKLERLDILVLSAGISCATPLTEMCLDEWRRVMNVNLDGAFLGLRSTLRVMLPQKNGSIVLIASASGIKAAAGASAYCASKAGLRMLAKAAALECKEHGIRVNTISPGGVATPMWTKMGFWHDLVSQHGNEEAAWEVLGGIDPQRPSLKRMALPEEIAKAVLFLASDEASHITGIDLAVDAGYTA